MGTAFLQSSWDGFGTGRGYFAHPTGLHIAHRCHASLFSHCSDGSIDACIFYQLCIAESCSVVHAKRFCNITSISKHVSHRASSLNSVQTALVMSDASPKRRSLIGFPSTVTHGTHVWGGSSALVASIAAATGGELVPSAMHL
jgi:hypothetical protein